MKAPSATLVVDAAILMAAVRGRSLAALRLASRHAALITTERAVEEVRRRLVLGLRRPELLAVLDDVVASINVEPLSALGALVDAGERVLRDAVDSRNGSTNDAHILALAWIARADIWSPGRNFAGTGVASWSTPNLIQALALKDV